MRMRVAHRFFLVALAAGLIPLLAAGAVFYFLGMTSDLDPGRIAARSGLAGLAAAVAAILAALAAGLATDRQVAEEAERAEARVTAAHELSRGRAAAGDGSDRSGASLQDLDRLARALAAETRGTPGPLLRRLLIFASRPLPKLPDGAPVAINAAVEVCVRALQTGGGAGGPRLHFDPDPNVTVAPLDPDMLHVLLLSLIQNAREAAGPDGRVDIRTQHLGAEILVAVRDDGPGVRPEVADRIFDPFYTTRDGAVGLGLTLCRQIAEAHGGVIRAANLLPRGLEVGVTFPTGPGTRAAGGSAADGAAHRV